VSFLLNLRQFIIFRINFIVISVW